MTKFYIPLIEVVVAFGLLYFMPELLIRIAQRLFGNTKNSLFRFIWENLKGYLFGTAIAITFYFAIGVSPEDVFKNVVRSGADFVRSSLGMDALSICVKRAKEEFRFDPDIFAEKVISFNLLAVTTLTPEQSLLAEGQKILLFEPPSSREDLLEKAYRSYCQS